MSRMIASPARALQWGRGSVAAEMKGARRNPRPEAKLQWGRGSVAAEMRLRAAGV